MAILKKERRGQTRYFFSSLMKFRLVSELTGTLHCCHTLNVSFTGICILTDYPLEAGQEISVEECLLPFRVDRAVVRWVSDLEEASVYDYMAGLEFQNTSLS